MTANMCDRLLASYQGRDGLIKTLGYTFMLAGGLTEGGLQRRFRTLSKEMSHCRVVLRLLDDWPMLQYSMQYGLGRHERDQLLRVVSVVKNMADQVFFPIEHIAWLGDKRILRMRDTDRLWTATKFLWAFSLYCGCIKAVRTLQHLDEQEKEIQNQFDTTEIRRAKAIQILSLLISFLNLINAISWLPKGVLWAGKLRPWHNGAIGLTASLLGLLQLLVVRK